jgi:hypothetical protein
MCTFILWTAQLGGWVLVDSQDAGNQSNLWCVEVAAAQPKHYQEFKKSGFVCDRYMPAWTIDELDAL